MEESGRTVIWGKLQAPNGVWEKCETPQSGCWRSPPRFKYAHLQNTSSKSY